jgi:tRNA(fMet)-specific endonuclease VapC
MFALDTDTVSFFLRGQGRVAERLAASDPASICIPSIVLHELRYGMLRAAGGTRKRDDLEAFLGAILVLPFDARSADAAAEARLELDRVGQQIGPFDILIAGTALAGGCILITHDVREFGRIPNLRVEDWY